MKEMANVEFVVGDIEISETDALSRSADSLKVIVSPAEPNEIDASVNASDMECSSPASTDDQTKSNRTDSASNSSTSSTSNDDSNSNDNRSKNSISIPESSYLKKKHRLISADSGFGSYGRSELFVTGSIDSVANIKTVPTHTTSMHTKPISKHDVSFSCLEQEQQLQRDHIVPLSVPHTAAISFVQRYEKVKSAPKNHTISFVNSIDESANNFSIDAKLINRCDGFKEVQCYFDEHGSPKVREKNRTRRKSTLKQELKARSLGASYDDETLRKIHQNKTPSCVSFTRLCKKFKETFCSKSFINNSQHRLTSFTQIA